jgi:hypothetical protein
LIFDHLWMTFATGGASRSSLRVTMVEMFQGEVARGYWDTARRSWIMGADGRRRRQFVTVVDEEFTKAVAVGPASIPAEFDFEHDSTSARPARRWMPYGGVAVGLVGGIALSKIFRWCSADRTIR